MSSSVAHASVAASALCALASRNAPVRVCGWGQAWCELQRQTADRNSRMQGSAAGTHAWKAAARGSAAQRTQRDQQLAQQEVVAPQQIDAVLRLVAVLEQRGCPLERDGRKPAAGVWARDGERPCIQIVVQARILSAAECQQGALHLLTCPCCPAPRCAAARLRDAMRVTVPSRWRPSAVVVSKRCCSGVRPAAARRCRGYLCPIRRTQLLARLLVQAGQRGQRGARFRNLRSCGCHAIQNHGPLVDVCGPMSSEAQACRLTAWAWAGSSNTRQHPLALPHPSWAHPCWAHTSPLQAPALPALARAPAGTRHPYRQGLARHGRAGKVGAPGAWHSTAPQRARSSRAPTSAPWPPAART